MQNGWWTHPKGHHVRWARHRDAANRTTNSALQGCLQAWLEDLQHQPWKPWVSNSRPYTLAIDCQGRRQTSRVEEGEPVGGEEDSQATEAPVCPHSTNPHKWLYLRKMPAGLRLPHWASQPQPAVQLDVILLLRCRFPLSSETDGYQQQQQRDRFKTRACLVLNTLLNESVVADVQVVRFCLTFEAVFQFKVKLLQVQEPAFNSHRRSAMEIVKEWYQGLVINFNGEWTPNKVQVAAFAGPTDGKGFAVDSRIPFLNLCQASAITLNCFPPFCFPL